MEDVRGYCPMGCGQTLFVGEGGHITCSWGMCPNPSAVDELLDTRETDHVVDIDETSFAVQHPLRERIGGELFGCSLHQEIAALDEPPMPPGRYRVTLLDDTWVPL